MSQKQFGSEESTGRKLDVIGAYLSMYQTALRNTGLSTIYIDGFAGTGEVPLAEHKDELFDEDVQVVMSGSADRAFNVNPPFSRYVFIDKRKTCIDSLKTKFQDHTNGPKASYFVGDANTHIKQLCSSERWRSQRGVILLDPFGSQVKWSTIEAIAATEALDLWYLFPAGLSVFRQISNSGTVDPTHGEAITRLLGTEDWRHAFLKPSRQPDLFGGPLSQEKVVTPESAALFMNERLETVFKGGVMEEMIPLGKHAYPSYYLLFAVGNPAKAATNLAKKLSKAALRATDRKNGRII